MTATDGQQDTIPRAADETPPPAGPGWDAFRTAPAFTLTDWEHD